MTKSPVVDYFTKELAQAYDERNKKLLPISECLHFLMGLSLKELPTHSRILCVGVGTGAEIFSLSKNFPEWTFVGVDPSASMIDVCRERLRDAKLLDRCELIHGDVFDIPKSESFDAVLSILVAHFVKKEERHDFYKAMINLLKKDGYLVNAEISYDLDSLEFPEMLKNWGQIQGLMGATTESLANLPKQLREILSIIPNTETEKILQECGIQNPIRFFQAFMITAWHGKRL